MMQLISKSNNLISSNKQNLILWVIDYQKLYLSPIKSFGGLIFNFTSVLNNSKIVIISDESLSLLDNNLDIL